MKPQHTFLMLITVAVWGFNFVATRVVLEVFSPQQLAFARSVLTLAVLLPWWKPFQRIPGKMMVAALAIGTFSFYLLYRAIDITESLTTVAVAVQLMPPLSAVLAMLFFHERISAMKWLGILLATAGAAYLAGATESQLSLAALGLTVLSVLFYAGGTIVIGKEKTVDIWRMLAWIAALSLPLLGLVAAMTGPVLPDLALMQLRHWSALVYVVIFSALMGQAVLFYLYRRYPVSAVAPWSLFIPLFVGLSAALVYGESITLGLVLGGAIVLLGVWIQQSSEPPVPGARAPYPGEK